MNPEIKAKVEEILKANGKRELSMDEMEQVVGGTSLLELVGELLFDTITEKIEDVFGKPDDGKCTGEQVMPGFNVY